MISAGRLMEGVELQSLRQTAQDSEKAFFELSSLRVAGLKSLQSPLFFEFYAHVT